MSALTLCNRRSNIIPTGTTFRHAFWRRTSPLKDDFFDSLINCNYVGYALKLEMVRTWQVIKGSLIKAAEYLIEAASGSPEVKFLFNPWWANPSTFGYTQVHRSLLAVRASALKA